VIDIIQLHYLEQLYACLKSLILSLFFKHIIILLTVNINFFF